MASVQHPPVAPGTDAPQQLFQPGMGFIVSAARGTATELHIPEHLGRLIDLEMLLQPGGKERTADEFAALFARAGLTLTRIVPTQSPLPVVEARPQ
jgi:hypothetical protein